MPAGPYNSYDKVPLLVGTTLNLTTASYKLALFTSASNAADFSNDEFGDLTNQVSGNGYPAGGVALTSPSVTQVDRDAVFRCADLSPAWSATGSGITFRYRVVYVMGTVSGLTNPVIAMALGDVLNVDVNIPAGNSRNEIFDPVKGILRLKGTV